MADYYGPQIDIMGQVHSWIKCKSQHHLHDTIIVWGMAISEAKAVVTLIYLKHARVFDPSFNCTQGPEVNELVVGN